MAKSSGQNRKQELPVVAPRVVQQSADAQPKPLPEKTVRPKPWKEDVEIGKMRESTARYIAWALVLGFLILLGLPFAYLGTTPKPTPEATAQAVTQTVDLIKTVSAVLSGLVGSVVMYYFGVEKRNQESSETE